MKNVFAAAVVGASVALAQNASLPECGSTCINNMIAKVQASPYGCPNNPTCFCCKPDFGYGIRDCANQYCADSNAATSAIVYAASYCASALPSDQTSVCTSFGGAAVTGGSAAASVTSSTGAGATANAYLVPVASGLSGYSVASTTITAGGPEATLSGTAYSALSTNGGVVATASGVTTTYSLNGLLGVQSAASGSGSGAGAGAGSAFIIPVASGSSGYSVASTTITAGGPEATLSGTEYSALSSDGGVQATASGVTTTYALTALEAIANATAGASGSGSAASSGSASGSGATTITTTTSGSGSAGTVTTTSTSTTSGAAAFITAAPALAGAAMLAVLAL